MWKDTMEFTILHFSKFHIQARIRSERNTTQTFTGIYGHPFTACRRETWALLRAIQPEHDSHLGQLGRGDFNELLSNAEKWGGIPRPKSQMQHFCSTLDEFHLQDLGFLGNRFTWCNGREGNDSICERPDQFTANKEWQELYPNWRVDHLVTSYSDHSPISIHTESVIVQTK